MGLTFSLTRSPASVPSSGRCWPPRSARGMQPVLGMVTFATGLASPFFLLALFPSYLQRLPRSGGWMARVKVVMGFIILAVSLKYLSAIDQVLQWNSSRASVSSPLGSSSSHGRSVSARLPASGRHRGRRDIWASGGRLRGRVPDFRDYAVPRHVRRAARRLRRLGSAGDRRARGSRAAAAVSNG